MKICSKCNQEKDRSFFSKDKYSKDGLQYSCKECCKIISPIEKENKRLRRIERTKQRILITTIQTCKVCLIPKLTDQFYKSGETKFGTRLECKLCSKEWNKSKKAKEILKKYNKSPKGKSKACTLSTIQRIKRKQTQPKWLTIEHKKLIRNIYLKCAELNKEAGYIKYHVDHIVPLCGIEVRGLHVPWNLQILEADLNRKKGNKNEQVF